MKPNSLYANNNFDLIRLIAAVQVTLVHAIVHLRVAPLTGIGLITEYAPGVPSFFFISGFLIAAAWERNPDVRVFYSNRAYRILPALWAGVIVGTITLFLFFDRRMLIDHAGQLAVWMIAQATFGQVWNPGFLRAYGVGVVNGSLWTIPVELSFYALTPVMAWILAGGRKSRGLFVALIVASFAFHYGLVAWAPRDPRPHLMQELALASPLPWVGMFLLGMLAQANISWLYPIVAGRALQFLAIFVCASIAGTRMPYPFFSGSGNHIGVLGYLSLCALILSAAYSRRGLSDRLLARNDLSYGLYIAHMIVINVCVQLGLVGFAGFAVAMPAAFALALVSWFLLEKRMLAKRKKSLYRR